MGRYMSFDFGLGLSHTCHKRKFRWLLKIPEISASGVNSLPPLKSARPTLNFKEMQVEHLTETIYYPSKPDWKPITLVLFDIKKPICHPVFDWIQRQYNPCDGKWYKPFENGVFKLTANLELYDGSGNVIETWIYENIWPQSVNFDDLDMSDSGYLTAELTLRYDRAYIACCPTCC